MTHMSRKVYGFFARMGSKQILKLQYRHSYAFIGIYGRCMFIEKRGASLKEAVELVKTFELGVPPEEAAAPSPPLDEESFGILESI